MQPIGLFVGVSWESTAHLDLRVLHIGNGLCNRLSENMHRKILLLGTAITMEQDFLNLLLAPFEIIVPSAPDRAEIDRIIFEELIVGLASPASRKWLQTVIAKHDDIDAVLPACNELGLLIRREDLDVDIYDSAHCRSLQPVDFALEMRS